MSFDVKQIAAEIASSPSYVDWAKDYPAMRAAIEQALEDAYNAGHSDGYEDGWHECGCEDTCSGIDAGSE